MRVIMEWYQPYLHAFVLTYFFGAITQQDAGLKASEMNKKATIPKFEYLAKMARSVGIRLLLANQSVRKELVPGKNSANITGRVSLGVSEPIEAEIALPETGIKVNLLSQPGEFYSIMNGPMNPEHGNSPYIPQSVANKLNDKLYEKFGKTEYVKTREQIMEEEGFTEKQDAKATTNTATTTATSKRTSHVPISDAQMAQAVQTHVNARRMDIRRKPMVTTRLPAILTTQTDLKEIFKWSCEERYLSLLSAKVGIIQKMLR